MDKRLDQIKEGAGLEESRINEELVEFLKRHSDKFTLLILIAAIGIVGQKWWHNYQISAENDAWAEYTAAAELGPQNLVEVANRYDGRVGLRLQALLDAADQYLDFVRLDLTEVAAMDALARPGAIFQNEYGEEERLTDEQRDEYLQAAEDLYSQVVGLAGSDPAKRLYVIQGLFGQAAVAEERREYDAARALYEQVIAQAEGLYPMHVELAQRRMETLDTLDDVVLPIPAPEQPEMPDLNLPEGLDMQPGAGFEDLLNQPGMGQPGTGQPGPLPPLRQPGEQTGDDTGDPADDAGADTTDEPADPGGENAEGGADGTGQ